MDEIAMKTTTQRIPPEVLAEQWYSFMHQLIGAMQVSFRQAGDVINQKVMAERLGKKPSFISRCLSGQQNMTIRTIHDLARSMDCRLEIRLRSLSSLQPANNQPSQPEPKAASSGSLMFFGNPVASAADTKLLLENAT
jgi:plasmid maintenance system antidote protein VapI